jgi:signal transduction histidine kinase
MSTETTDPRTDSGDGNASVDLVLTTHELIKRGSRSPEYEAEGRALSLLIDKVTDPAADVLQILVETALTLCSAQSAVISLLTDDGESFQWRAVAGQWAQFAGEEMPRNSSPCGMVLDQNHALLFSHPERYYPIAALLPLISEALLIPFHLRGEPIGTIWLIAHDETCRFDLEDERLVTSLGKFASTICHIQKMQALAEARVSENARLYVEALSANHARDEFFAALSHELRTPLTSVLGWAGLLARGPDIELVQQAAAAITSAASLQALLVDDLLDISRVMTGKFALTRAPVNLPMIVEEAVTSVRPIANAKGLSVRSQSSSGPTMMSGDATKLRQVINNLLSNALKFTPSGGLITIDLQQHGANAVITVSDTGEGIPREFLPRVFDRYAQVGERRLGGMGLGLAIAKQIVDVHGGSIAASSEGPGKGSTFVVILPLLTVDDPDSIPGYNL